MKIRNIPHSCVPNINQKCRSLPRMKEMMLILPARHREELSESMGTTILGQWRQDKHLQVNTLPHPQRNDPKQAQMQIKIAFLSRYVSRLLIKGTPSTGSS